MKEIKQKPLKSVLSIFIDKGEAEAIALALDLGALVLLDEKDARRIAEKAGLKVLGTIGVLILAKHQSGSCQEHKKGA